jgi:hypothetical protein
MAAKGALGTYEQSGPSAPQTARAVLAEIGAQQKGFGNLPARLVTAFAASNSNLIFQARASGAGGESITVALTPSTIAQLAAPASAAAAANVGGGAFAAATYFWKVTAINAEGETTGSNEATVAVAASGTATITWAAVAGATGYRIYRSASTGTENGATQFVAAVGAVLTYTDLGAALAAGGVPAVNTADTGEVQAIVVNTSGNAITVVLPVDEAGNADATAAAVRDAVNTDPVANLLVAVAFAAGNGSGIVSALSATNLAGDAIVGSGQDGNAPLPAQHPIHDSYATARY